MTRCSGPEVDAEAQAEIEALSHEIVELHRAMALPDEVEGRGSSGRHRERAPRYRGQYGENRR